ncbi:hypothetical protein M758_3G121000 [Ceratodon purpureus]|nr:hypothetical protein M758_3G121000 [Ceratodon purpureus]
MSCLVRGCSAFALLSSTPCALQEGRKWVPKLPGAVQCSDLGFNRLRPAERHRKAPSCIQSGNYLALVLRDCLHFIYLVASALHCIALHSHEGILVRSPTHNPSA